MKIQNTKAFTRIELILSISFIAIIASRAPSASERVIGNANHMRQINNVKQIALACQLFAADHDGVFPNGNYDATLRKITSAIPAGTAEACFNDLIESGKLEVERVFWSSDHSTQCAPEKPDENGTLEGEENCWDYIAGLNNDSPAFLPLLFEASDKGTATTWTEDAGHPWEDIVIVGYVDGSADKAKLSRDHTLLITRAGTETHLCLPAPGTDPWPTTAKLAPATPAP